MFARHFDILLNALVHTQIQNLNSQWVRPFDISSLDPMTLGFLKNMITNLHLSPFYQEEFYYLGFSYFVDNSP
jgi:hypothetical protein